MPINMEVKKDGLRQTQDGIWKLTLTIHPHDMPVELMTAPMGMPYGLAMTPIDYDNTETPEAEIPIAEKSEGEKLRVLAIMRCKDLLFQSFTRATFACGNIVVDNPEELARIYICKYIAVKSRSEIATNEEAQRLFCELDCKYKDWIFEQQHAENLGRV